MPGGSAGATGYPESDLRAQGEHARHPVPARCILTLGRVSLSGRARVEARLAAFQWLRPALDLQAEAAHTR